VAAQAKRASPIRQQVVEMAETVLLRQLLALQLFVEAAVEPERAPREAVEQVAPAGAVTDVRTAEPTRLEAQIPAAAVAVETTATRHLEAGREKMAAQA
jgi:hypothetical protein